MGAASSATPSASCPILAKTLTGLPPSAMLTSTVASAATPVGGGTYVSTEGDSTDGYHSLSAFINDRTGSHLHAERSVV